MSDLATKAGKLYEELEKFEDSSEKLDDLVIDAGCSIASAVNNGGVYSQIEFLLGHGYTDDEIRGAFKDE